MQSPMSNAAESPAEYLSQAAGVARSLFTRYPEHALDEQAGPAYLQGFALSRWIFWQRIKKVIKLLPAGGERCLDFGCGFGMMLPLLKRRFAEVRGVDLMPDLAQTYLHLWDEQTGQQHADIQITRDLDSAGLPENSLDLILAMDVLEHVDQLPELLGAMARLLKPEGVLLVTGPTENWFYKFGRRLVGFSGDYHVRDIYDIRNEMEQHLRVSLAGRVFFPVTLFHILRGEALRGAGRSLPKAGDE